jgi:hypothetical protein
MKISKETWKDILKIVGTIIATIASVLGVQAMPLKNSITKLKKCAGSRNTYFRRTYLRNI